MSFELPPLPYALDALEPHVSRRTLEFHHGKHHKAYVDKTNSLVAGTPYERKTLKGIMLDASEKGDQAIFNNAAQAWNHDFFWHCMKPGGGRPTGEMADRLNGAFGSYENFHQKFVDAAVGRFGSGWAWLMLKNGKLEIISTGNAGNPVTEGAICLLTCDVWEHAYYLDYQNRRNDFVIAFLDHLANWDFATAQLAKA